LGRGADPSSPLSGFTNYSGPTSGRGKFAALALDDEAQINAVLWIRNPKDPHHFDNLNPDLHQIKNQNSQQGDKSNPDPGIHNTGLMTTERVVLSAYVCSVLLTLYCL
jgi:hypothetical protein